MSNVKQLNENPLTPLSPTDKEGGLLEVKAGEVTRVHIAPYGDWPTVIDGKQVAQRVTRKAYQDMLDELAGEPREILVDKDHNSDRAEDQRDTTAMAWATNLQDGPDGIYMDFKWTDAGARLIGSRAFRFVSPTWLLDNKYSPVKLLRIALTNRPAFRTLEPILNTEKDPIMTNKPDKTDKTDELEKAANETTDTPDVVEAPEAPEDVEGVTMEALAQLARELIDALTAFTATNEEQEKEEDEPETTETPEVPAEPTEPVETEDKDKVTNSDKDEATKSAVLQDTPATPPKVVTKRKVCNTDVIERPEDTFSDPLIKQMNTLSGVEKLNFIKANSDKLAQAMNVSND